MPFFEKESHLKPGMIGNVLLALGLPIIPLINKNLSYKQKSQNFDLSDQLKPLWTMHVHVTNLAFLFITEIFFIFRGIIGSPKANNTIQIISA